MSREARVANRYDHFRTHLRRYCDDHDQSEVAAAGGITRQYLCKIINIPSVMPSMRTCLSLADVMRKPLGDLLKR